MPISRKHIPNIISCFRIVGTAALIFTEAFTPAFFVIYTLAGLSDILDGTLARAMGCVSRFGAKLDSAADLIYYSMMLIKIFPVLWEILPGWIWLIVGLSVLIRLFIYGCAAIKERRFASSHTILNKLTGLMIFCIPYVIKLSFSVYFCFTVALIALFAAFYELSVQFGHKDRKNA